MADKAKPSGAIPSAPDPAAKPGPDEAPRVELKAIPPADPRDAEVALLKTQVQALLDANEDTQAMLRSHAVNAGDALQQAKSKAEQEALKAEIDKGNARRTQEEADRRYPAGRHRYRCSLPDGNGHPEICVTAENEVDAAARFKDVCGVRSSEKEVLVARA